MPAWFGDSKFIAGTNGDNVQHIGNYQGFPSATLFSSATGSWSNGTSLPTTDLLYATIGFTDANKVHATSLNSGGTNYIRNGTGAWTASGTSPANLFGTANNRLNNNGWVWPQNGGTSYKLSGYGGTYSASIDFGYRPTVAWASQNNWTMYNENSTTAIYLVTDSGLISTGQTGPTLAGYTWLSYVLAGYGNELHMFAGRRTSPPNPSYPGVNLHYKATITN
jgi:hypothetical protein